VDLAIEAASKASAAAIGGSTADGDRMAGSPRREGRRVFTLGPLIHNPQAVAELEALGVFALDEADIDARVSGATVVIRAHGVAPEAIARLEALGARVVDATCPRVLASQRRAADWARKGYAVVIAGDRDHGEVTGIAGYARAAEQETNAARAAAAQNRTPNLSAAGASNSPCFVVGSAEEAAALVIEGPVALIAQTTIKAAEYEAIRAALAIGHPTLEVVDSICPATGDRQRALEELAASCDAIVVVGGRNSANTTRLLSSALASGKPAWLVETAAELPAEIRAYATVGVTAGASTPDALVDEVESALLCGSLK